MTLPNFLIIGAPRSGTTSLYEYLRQHPEIFMSPLKETNFFLFDGKEPGFRGPDGMIINRDSIYRLDDYRKLFEKKSTETAIGEASPRYIHTEGTAKRITELIPDAKIIAILRNPVDRACSHFAHRRRDGWESCSRLEEAIEQERDRISNDWAGGIYLQRGFYGRQLREYYESFPRGQIKIYLYEELLEDPIGLLKDIFEFLGVSANFTPDISSRFNTSGIIKNPVLRFIWIRTHPVQAVIRPFLSKMTRQRISGLFISLEKEKIVFSEELRENLRKLYRQDIINLQRLIERDLSNWLG